MWQIKKLNTIFFIFLLFFFTNNISAQTIDKGNSLIKIGYGLCNFSSLSISKNVNNKDKNMVSYKYHYLGTIYLKYEYLINNNLSFNINTAYIKHNASNNYTLFIYDKKTDVVKYIYPKETLEYQTFSLIFRVNHIFFGYKRFNIYFGYGLGYRVWFVNYTDEYNSSNNSDIQTIATNKIKFDNSFSDLPPVGFEITAGYRYLISKNIGLYFEYGIAKSFIQFGLMGKF